MSLISDSVNTCSIDKSPPRLQIKSIGSDTALYELDGVTNTPTTFPSSDDCTDIWLKYSARRCTLSTPNVAINSLYSLTRSPAPNTIISRTRQLERCKAARYAIDRSDDRCVCRMSPSISKKSRRREKIAGPTLKARSYRYL